MLGCSVANKTVFSSAIGNNIVPILSTLSSCVSSKTCCLGSTISSSYCTKVEASCVSTCKSCTSIVVLRIGGSTLSSLVCDTSELLVCYLCLLVMPDTPQLVMPRVLQADSRRGFLGFVLLFSSFSLSLFPQLLSCIKVQSNIHTQLSNVSISCCHTYITIF